MQDDVDEGERTRQIRRVLSCFDERFTKYLASTIAFSEKLPEEVNNQVRNAFTHLARAQDATTSSSFQREIERSISHIERANRDCLKASIIVARDELDSLISDAVFYYVGLTPDLKARCKKIVRLRREAYRAESRGESGQVERLEEILRETIHTGDLIREQYREAGTKKAKWLRFGHRWSGPVMTLLALIVGYVSRPFVTSLSEYFQELLRTSF